MRSAPHKKRESGLFKEVWRAYNELVDFCREIAPLQSGRGVKVTRTSNGTLLQADIPEVSGGSGVVKQFLVKSVQDDYITCVEFDGTNETGGSVLVAKPFNLRRTGWHGVTVNYTLEGYPSSPGTLAITYSMTSAVYRTATIGSSVEHQVIIPRYVPNKSVIFASQSENETGVDAAEWQDLNVDGRAWAMVL